MKNLKLSKQNKLILEARAGHQEKSGSERNLSGIQTWTLKRKNMHVVKATPIILETQPTFVPSSGESNLGSPKRMKTLMINNVS